AHGVTLHRQTQVAQIEKDNQNKVEAVLTQNGERIPCQWVGITIGVQPNIACFKDSGLTLDRGILVDEYLAT
ncbi:MAG: FAD-dependent oxidoreductase, partial [Flavobacteriaceae bacterium]